MAQYEIYGKMAADGVDETYQNGRYIVQKDNEANIARDVISKLKISPDDVVLDVGCGMGTNLYPISEIARSIDCCDHPNVIERLKKKKAPLNVSFLGGSFTELDFPRQYSKVLIYSVFPSLPDKETVYAFLDKALALMADSSACLIGDIANIDKKKRFLNSQRGQKFQEEWQALRDGNTDTEHLSKYSDSSVHTAIMDDDFLLGMIKYVRAKGYHAYMLEQPSNLPFGNTREDMLITTAEYENR